jgi:excisionase family DNA binding protein
MPAIHNRAPVDTRVFMSVPEAAEYIGVSVATIWRRIAEGSLTAYRFGPRSTRVNRDELHAMTTVDVDIDGGAA